MLSYVARVPRLAAAACAAACCFVAVAAAQDTVSPPFQQTVVVTAAATPVAIGQTARAVTVITRDQIRQLPVHTVADVLRLAASVDVRARGERGVQTDFAIRGANFGQMLMLVDGVRLNDAQSGHHNGDIPVPIDAVERIEILHGAGSSLFGADAFGGTINVITRRGVAPAALTVRGGSFGSAGARGQVGVARGTITQTFAAAADYSDGFMFERGYRTAGLSSRTSVGEGTGLLVSYLWKDFGANGFYGNAPSHEWTNQTLAALDHSRVVAGGWRLAANASYRTHGDHFLFNVTRPGVSENRHRTHAVIGTMRASHAAGPRGTLTAGAEAGGDWMTSSNLGNHTIARGSAFAEYRYAAPRVQWDAGLRVDRYNEFGAAWSPAVGGAWWPAARVRLRASVARAFRVPTFTERYYRDPANWARPEVGPERAWAADSGVDLFAGPLSLGVTLFTRAEADVIDWLRPTPADIWRTYNVRDVDTVGLEVTARRTFAGGAFVQAGYTGLDVDAAAVTQLSKYVLDYAPHAVTLAAAFPAGGGVRLAPRVEYKRRSRSSGTSDYTLVDARLARRIGGVDLFVEGTNLLDHTYQEVAGVAMPGRAVMAGISVAGPAPAASGSAGSRVPTPDPRRGSR